MKTLQLNGFYCGIVTTELGSEEHISETRKQWTKEGRICWISRVNHEHNPESLDGE